VTLLPEKAKRKGRGITDEREEKQERNAPVIVQRDFSEGKAVFRR